MLKQKIIPFTIWCLVGIVASGFFLQSPDRTTLASHIEQKPSSVTFSDNNITQLFSALSSSPAPLTNHLNFSLVGIIYSTQPTLSRVMLQSGSEPPQKYAINEKTPDNGIISKITKKSFEYLSNGEIRSIDLPQESPTQKKQI